ncbi:cyclic pyranopterin monophosphate synthase MoaC [Synechococcus sp. RSCCF101]|uniref:cyclic pyranopterin monophosphate synthase MoaC n=1 Tax=Synechococcus sp. RSCCF101 TaxID=2511069 RepID=UPI001247B6A0|nr:cyclic pyranopterin monophosphate synthase MoaC [Synechococcus sp. RSCCF101]QEY32610.1 cyclic pyranopterin monophosphate synthase MoaC [Synechococcus sp. RSCCF101]
MEDSALTPTDPVSTDPARPAQEALTHLNSAGQVHMVDVGGRPARRRRAVAEGWIRMQPQVCDRLLAGRAPKGDVLAVARVAAIQAAKRTWELIPLCHPLALTSIQVAVEPAAPPGVEAGPAAALRLSAEVSTEGPTGVEMEALTAVQIGLLTLYDMAKALDPAMTIGPVRVLSKEGGRHGPWRHPDALPAEQRHD